LADTDFPSEKKFEVENFQLLTMIFSENVLSVENFLEWKWALTINKHRGVGTGGHVPPPNFFKGLKVPFFVIKSALFVQANVAVNTKLTSKVPFSDLPRFPHFA
jgi:hypothetical protein